MEINNTARAAIAGLTLSAAGFAAYLGYEGYSDTAVPPIAGDVPTYGFGTTRGPDGKPLKGGERITPPQAVQLAMRDVIVHQGPLKRCLDGVAIWQYEFDAYMSLELNTHSVCASSIPAKLRAGDYAAACATILDFNKFCERPKTRNAEGKWVCPPGALKPKAGLTNRRQKEYLMCIGKAGDQHD